MIIPKIPPTAQIFIAMIVGLIVGHYVELIDGVSSIAQGFIMLLQMTALPYIALSLIVGFGSLTLSKARKTMKVSVLIFFLLTLISLFFILISPIAFPDWENASFYNANTIKTEPVFSLIDLFVPANPFNAFATGSIPAIALFSVFVGLGLMTVPKKRAALNVLTILQKSVANINSLVMKYFAPVGIFCIAYRATATLDASQVEGLTVYIVTAFFNVFLLALIVLPALIASITTFTYRQVLNIFKTAMLTAFATGSFLAVIPLIVESTKKELAGLSGLDSDLAKAPDIFIPISFSLPVGGKLLPLLFVLFAAWFSGAYISYQEYIKLIFFGFPQLFATAIVATPQLLDLFNVSNEVMELFIVAENLIVARMGAVLSVSFSTCFTLLIVAVMSKKMVLKPAYLLGNTILVSSITVAALFALQLGFEGLSLQYKGYDKFIQRDLIHTRVSSKYLDEPAPNSTNVQPFTDVLTRIRGRGFIRVGYFRDDLPYAFHNHKAQLVGFDIEVINLLASDLKVDVEYVKIFHNEAQPLLASGYLDMTTGVPVIPDNMRRFSLSAPYSQQSLAIIVKDERRAEFTEWQAIITNEALVLGIPETFFYEDAVSAFFKHDTAWELSTPRLFFREEYDNIDGMIFGAPAASAWTLLYPNYTVVMPKPVRPPLNMAFPINRNDQAFELYLRNWIQMKQQSHELDRIFAYWIEGKAS
jgi:proton glutamate symport protein